MASLSDMITSRAASDDEQMEDEKVNPMPATTADALIGGAGNPDEEPQPGAVGANLDNLFGDDEENKEEDAEDVLNEEPSLLRAAEDDVQLEGAPSEDDENLEEHRVIDVNIPFTHQPEPTSELYAVRMPNFLTIDPKEFDNVAYLEDAVADNDTSDLTRTDRIKLRSEHTIRWRMHNGKKQSNAKFIRWDDGSLSLLLGSEMFDVSKKPMSQEYSYLASSLPAQGLLAVHKAFSHSLSFMPTSTSSLTHKRLTEAIAKRQVKSRGVQSVETLQDPEKLKREAEKLEESRLKSKRKLESQRRAAGARYERELGLTAEGLEAEDDIGAARGDTYTADDFVVDDESEEEDRTSRLQNLKRKGADQYKRRKKLAENEEEEVEDGEDEEKEEEEEEEAKFTDEDEDDAQPPPEEAALDSASRTKRRRVVADSDEE